MTSVELPSPLRAALERELAGASRRDLAQRSAATTAAYRGGAGSSTAIKGASDALAYALTRLPATYAACAVAFEEAARAAPDFAPASLLDAGCGPGTGSWAAREAWPSLRRIDWFDASPPFLALAQRLAEGQLDAEARRGDLTAGDFPTAELVIASYALAEIAPAAQTKVVLDLWAAAESMLILVEPGTPAGFERLRAARAALIAADARIAAPCPHDATCPIVAPDWCHFSVRLPRSRDHRLAKGADAPFEDEKYAYVVAARPHVGLAAAASRVLTRPRMTKPGIELKLCRVEGIEHGLVPRRDKVSFAAARRLDWGDSWP
ncbi:MAG: small ribosomal subunit Rsm22 family protein [Pseudomonadota bacterium]